MDNLLTFLAKEITGTPQVEVSSEEKNGLVVYSLTVPKEFVGQLIGKGGRIIASIRTIANVHAAKENKRVGVEVKEKQD